MSSHIFRLSWTRRYTRKQKHQNCSKLFKQPRLPRFCFPFTWLPSWKASPCYMGIFLCLLCNPFIFPSEKRCGQEEEGPCSTLPSCCWIMMRPNLDDELQTFPLLCCKWRWTFRFQPQVLRGLCGTSQHFWVILTGLPFSGNQWGLQMQTGEMLDVTRREFRCY